MSIFALSGGDAIDAYVCSVTERAARLETVAVSFGGDLIWVGVIRGVAVFLAA